MAVRTYHPLTFVAFLLAVFLLVLPGQADGVASSLYSNKIWEAGLGVLATLGIVIAPLVYSQWRTRTHPEKYRPRLLSTITWAIIGLNVALNVVKLTAYITYAS